MLPGIIFIIISAVLFLMAYLLYFRQAYWLISGVNLSPRETVHERYDLPGLMRHMGRMCALIVPVLLFGTERYMYVERKKQRTVSYYIVARKI